MKLTERKKWIDNLRWMTIVLVVIFHCFYYYNNIGGAAMFERLSANPELDGGKPVVTFAGIVQYGVYQWFMLLLFVISGMCAKYTLQKKSMKQFLKARVQKLLVPSTLGILSVQWLGGWLITVKFLTGESAEQTPGFVKYIISVFSGVGALWFCHVLFVACLVLALIKLIDKKCRLEKLGAKSNMLAAALLVIVMIGAAQILNVSMIPTYRFAYDTMAFLFGYYVFSSEKLLGQLKKYGWIYLIIGLVFGVFYFLFFYGQSYSAANVQNNFATIIHAWFTMMGILGIAQNILEFDNKLSSYMGKVSWGIYINHILIMLIMNTILQPVVHNIPVTVLYILEFVVTMGLSIAFYEMFRRIPVLRYVLYGIKKEKTVV